MGMKEAKPVSTPGDNLVKVANGNGDALDGRQDSKLRKMAARANYLAADRVDMMYATQEICRGMAKPEEKEMTKMKRLARY